MGLWLVADGMGGHHGGEIASCTVAEAFADYTEPASIDDAIADSHRRLQAASSEIQVLRAEAGTMMGTTAVVLLLHGASWICLWAGDSRCYRLSGGKLSLLTRDHNLLQDAIARGDDETSVDPHKAAQITRAVGASDRLLVDQAVGSIDSGDLFLLCTDGLNSIIDDKILEQILVSHSPTEAASRLIELCANRAVRDDVTFSIVCVQASAV